MRPATRPGDSTLPLHRGGAGAGSASSNGASGMTQLQQALNKGLGKFAASTKAGAGEKERAFVVRENAVLRGVLCLLVLASLAAIALFSTVFELHVAKRGLIQSEVVHHKREHQSHEALVRANLGLQHALETAVEETQAMQEFRAYFEKTVGVSDDNLDALFKDQGVKPEVLGQAKQMHRLFVKSIEEHLGRLLARFQKRAEEAEKEMSQLSQRINRDIQADARAEERFAEKLEEMGTDEEYAEDVQEQYQEQHQKELSPEDRAAEAAEEEEARGDEKEIEDQLHAFFERLRALDAPAVAPETLKKWEDAVEQILDTLEDPQKEVDLDTAAAQLKALFQDTLKDARFAPPAGASAVAFYQALVEKCKIVPHKQALLDLYEGVLAAKKASDDGGDDDGKPHITALTVLSNVERLASENGLFHLLDWLSGEDSDAAAEFKDEQ